MATQNERLELPNGMDAQLDPAQRSIRVRYAGGIQRTATITAPLGRNDSWNIIIHEEGRLPPIAEHSADSLEAAIDLLNTDKELVIAAQNEQRENLRYQREVMEQEWKALVLRHLEIPPTA